MAYFCGKISFPRDEGDKDTLFDWWYITLHFTTRTKKSYSYTLAYLSRPTYCTRQTSITDEKNQTFFWETKRGHLEAKKGYLDLTYWSKNADKDYWRQKNNQPFCYELTTKIGNKFNLAVTLESKKLPVVHGDSGLVDMGIGGKSFYYSQTNLTVHGSFSVEGKTESITGVAWIDRQWGAWSTKGFDGWEWFALQLNDRTELMIYQFFDPVTGKPINQFFTIIFEDGTFVYSEDPSLLILKTLNYFKVKNSGPLGCLQNVLARWYLASGWRLQIPRYGFDLYIKPVLKNQRIGQGTWEGSCYVTGYHNKNPINCISTVELTHLYVYPFQVRWLKNLVYRMIS